MSVSTICITKFPPMYQPEKIKILNVSAYLDKYHTSVCARTPALCVVIYIVIVEEWQYMSEVVPFSPWLPCNI